MLGQATGGNVAQLGSRALLKQVQLPSAARNFSPRINFQYRLSYSVCTATRVHALTSVCMFKIPGIGSHTTDSGEQSNHHKWLASQTIWGVEELETIPVGTKLRTSQHWSPGGERWKKRKHLTMFFERTRKGCHQSDKHWNSFKDNRGETSEMEWSAHGLFWAQRYHLELNRTEQTLLHQQD